MNDKHVKGTFHEVKGTAKENLGHAAGDSKMEGEGILERVKGKVEKGIGDLKDAIKDRIDRTLEKDKRRSA